MAASKCRRHAPGSVRAQCQTSDRGAVAATRQIEDEEREDEAAEAVDERPAKEHPCRARQRAKVFPERGVLRHRSKIRRKTCGPLAPRRLATWRVAVRIR